MPQSRRTDIIDFLVSNLKEIDGAQSGFDSSYTYNENIFNNVYRKIKFLDEVNDFPALYLNAGTEIRDFNTKSLTVATLDVTIRAYVYGEDDSQTKADELIQDIEHVIYNLEGSPEKGILNIQIDNVSTDEGLAEPLGLAEIILTVEYRLED
jgi:hypothetical protein|tara:strand:+ start:17524 stop:17979 length:456 start_codon:yes stop_codon:yes gene_type:complete